MTNSPTGPGPKQPEVFWVSSVIRREPNEIVVITHYDLAIYCHMLHRIGERKLPCLKVVRVSPGRHEFYFRDPDHIVEAVQLAFANGTRDTWFAEAQRSMKSLMRDSSNMDFQQGQVKRERTNKERTEQHKQPSPPVVLQKRGLAR